MRQATFAALVATTSSVIANPVGISARTDENLPWMNITCALGPSGNLSTPLKIWDALYADEAWKYAVDKWKVARDSKTNTTSFREFVVKDTLNGPVCEFELTYSQNCTTESLMCDDETALKPAVFVLSASFTKIKEFYNTIRWAGNEIEPDISWRDYNEKAIVENLPDPDNTYLHSAAGGFEAILLKKTFDLNPWVYGDNEATRTEAEDAVLAVRDFSFARSVEYNKEKSRWYTYRDFVEEWMENVAYKSISHAWNGDDASIDYLTKLIGGGRLTTLNWISNNDTSLLALKTMQSFWIPFLWKFRESHPVLLDLNAACTSIPKGQVANGTSEFCINNRLYYLRDAKGDPETLSFLPEIDSVSRVKFPYQSNSTITNLPLVSLYDIAASVVARHEKLGNRALGSLPETEEDKAALQSLWKDIILDKDDKLLPAIINIPLCDQETVKRNLDRVVNKKQKLNMDIYPCNEASEKAQNSGASIRGPVSWLFPTVLGVMAAVFL
ncbi:hypothetical protein QBC38DRAFT_16084 [Podospora fimiseda]|uniref:Uncharacterized protein n=1 Tax=Podospora fimiseda TaxID=252190 RepID=A0AAN7BJN5_9PEZI|nr:hypothetical protein QBC38DRAFT_16084 [Podospora fimiseda]